MRNLRQIFSSDPIGLLAVGLLIGFLLSPRLWTTNRSYPLVPAISWLSDLFSIFEPFLFFSLIVLASTLIIFPLGRLPRIVLVVVLFVAALADQNRLQGWIYIYWLLIVGSLLARSEISRNTLWRILLASVYLWSGVQKFNGTFLHSIFPWFVSAIFPAVTVSPYLYLLALLAVILETSIGLGLLFGYSSKIFALAAIGMHLFILMALGPLGHNYNSIVWPFNIICIFLLCNLFLTGNSFTGPIQMIKTLSLSERAFALLLILLPSLSFLGLWDHYLSFAFYSGNVPNGKIAIVREILEELPLPAKQFVTETPTEVVLDLMEWSYQDLNVPAVTEPRVINKVIDQLGQKKGAVEDSL